MCVSTFSLPPSPSRRVGISFPVCQGVGKHWDHRTAPFPPHPPTWSMTASFEETPESPLTHVVWFCFTTWFKFSFKPTLILKLIVLKLSLECTEASCTPSGRKQWFLKGHYSLKGSLFLQYHPPLWVSARRKLALTLRSYLKHLSMQLGLQGALEWDFTPIVLYLVRAVKQKFWFFFFYLVNCLPEYIDLLLWSRILAWFFFHRGRFLSWWRILS